MLKNSKLQRKYGFLTAVILFLTYQFLLFTTSTWSPLSISSPTKFNLLNLSKNIRSAENFNNSTKLVYYRSLITNPNFNTTVDNYRCINIVLPSASGGLRVDAAIYHKGLQSSEIVAGYQSANEKEVQAIRSSKADIYLEQTPHDMYGGGFYTKHMVKPHFWWMINTEWSEKNHFTNVSFIIAKTNYTLEKLREYRNDHQLAYAIYYTKHTSNDIYLSNITKNYNEFLHLAGTSGMKNTHLILTAWSEHPEWPKITIISQVEGIMEHYKKLHLEKKMENVLFRSDRLSFTELITLQNQIGIHVCPSAVEGYGHYVNEARSSKALVITGNIHPTNELITEDFGILVGKPSVEYHMGFLQAEWLDINQTDLEESIEQVLSLTLEEKQRMGEKARDAFLTDQNHCFTSLQALNDLVCDEKDTTEFLNYVY